MRSGGKKQVLQVSGIDFYPWDCSTSCSQNHWNQGSAIQLAFFTALLKYNWYTNLHIFNANNLMWEWCVVIYLCLQMTGSGRQKVKPHPSYWWVHWGERSCSRREENTLLPVSIRWEGGSLPPRRKSPRYGEFQVQDQQDALVLHHQEKQSPRNEAERYGEQNGEREQSEMNTFTQNGMKGQLSQTGSIYYKFLCSWTQHFISQNVLYIVETLS